MTGSDSGSLPFEPPEQENARLREENTRPRRLLAVHGIAIPQLTPAAGGCIYSLGDAGTTQIGLDQA